MRPHRGLGLLLRPPMQTANRAYEPHPAFAEAHDRGNPRYAPELGRDQRFGRIPGPTWTGAG
jgi:hypothetical protein